MPIRNFRDLQCWQLAHQLRQAAIAITDNDGIARDGRFCHGFRDAAGSVCRNIAEGFCRFESSFIVQFFGYALASLGETQDYLEECRLRRLLDQPEFERLWDLSEHTRAALLAFQRTHRDKLTRSGRRPLRR